MDKVKKALTSDYAKKLYRICAYMLIEVSASAALIDYLGVNIPDKYIYGLVIVLIVAAKNALKEVLGEDNRIAKVI